MATTGAPVEYTTAAAAEEKAKLQKHFSRFDIYFFLICTIVGVDTLGQVASNGAEGLTWLLVLAFLFFIPYAFLTGRARGRVHRGGRLLRLDDASPAGDSSPCINAVFYWFSNPVWIGGALVLLDARGHRHLLLRHLHRRLPLVRRRHRLHLVQRVVGDPLVRHRQVDPDARRLVPHGRCSAASRSSALIYAISNGLSLPAAGDFSPTYGLFIVLVPLLFFNYVGFELPNAAGDEMEDPQSDVPITVLRACDHGDPDVRPARSSRSCACCRSRRSPAWAASWTRSRPSSRSSAASSQVASDGTLVVTLTGAGKALGYVAAFGFVLALVSSACTWLMGSDRSQAVAAYDGCGPRWLGTFSAKYGTPINVNFTSGVLSTIVFIFASQLERRQRQDLRGDDRRRAAVHDDVVHPDLPDGDQAAQVAWPTSTGRSGSRSAWTACGSAA